MNNYKYVIVGSSIAAVSAARSLRKTDNRGSLAVISQETNPTYSRPLIYEFLCKKMKEKDLNFCETDVFKALNIEPLLGVKATAINTGAHRIKLSDGKEIGYEKLLIATGGKPINPPIKGMDLKNVFNFTSLSDAKKIARGLSRIHSCVVIGVWT